jgi:hypothetical protein
MKRGEKVRVVAEVVELRRTQRLAAEMAFARANATVRQLEEQREHSLTALVGDQRAWSAKVAGASLELPLVRSWMTAIEDAEAELRRLTSQVRTAEDLSARHKTELVASEGRLEAAEALAKAARRRLAQAREEVSLGEADDRSAGRRVLL